MNDHVYAFTILRKHLPGCLISFLLHSTIYIYLNIDSLAVHGCQRQRPIYVYMYVRFCPRARLALNIFLPRIKSADYNIISIQALNNHGRQSNDDIDFS